MFEGYLVKIKGIEGGQPIASFDYTIPNRAIIYATYEATYSTLDGDSKRNGTGRLKRKTYEHKVAHCTFSLMPMNSAELWSILELIRARYVKQRQKKVKASIWIPEINDYVEDYFYFPDTKFTVNKIEDNTVKYAQTDIELIGY